jgi:hypothetical protein
MGSLRKLNYFDETALNNCIDASISSNGRLSGPAAETIKYFYAQGKYKKLITDSFKNRNSTTREKEILSKMIQ